MNKKIGFVILTWNSDKYIEDCLQSIFDIGKYEKYVAVIDNGSKDKTLYILDQISIPKNVYLYVIRHSKNIGTTKTRNEGILYLKQFDLDYICILDSDTRINEEALDILIEELDRNPSYGIVGPTLIGDDNSIQISARQFPNLKDKIISRLSNRSYISKEDDTLKDKHSYSTDYLMSACWLFKQELIYRIGLFNERYFYAPEDVEYCLRLWKDGSKVIYVPRAKIYHAWQRLSKKKLLSGHNFTHICGLIHFCLKYKQDIKDIQRKIHDEQ